MREVINKFGPYIAIGAIVVAGIVAWFSMKSKTEGGAVSRNLAFYVDEETGEESVQAADAIPPLIGKSGKPTVVKAMKYTCDGGKTNKTYALMRYSPDVQERLKNLSASDPVQDAERAKLLGAYFVRSPEPNSRWVPAQSTEGLRIGSIPMCPNGKPGEMAFP
jgi:hypothetical protein